MESSLDRLATFSNGDELRKKIVSASTYPAVVMSFARSWYFFATVIMPFADVFTDIAHFDEALSTARVVKPPLALPVGLVLLFFRNLCPVKK